jgi:WD40 repeat protein
LEKSTSGNLTISINDIDADGRLIHWHCTTGQLLSTIQEGDSQINCVTYQGGNISYVDGTPAAPGSGSAALNSGAPTGAAGKRFATCGSDMYIRVYDGATHKKIAQMVTGYEPHEIDSYELTASPWICKTRRNHCWPQQPCILCEVPPSRPECSH